VNLRRSILVVVLLLAVAAALGVTAWRQGERPAQATRPAEVAPDPRTERALSILRAWDQARAQAWHAGSIPALGRLYSSGSAAGAHDRAMLTAYLERGLVVDGMRTQVLSATVREAGATRLVVVVTDRLANATAVSRADPSRRWALPRDVPTTRTVSLVRREGRWLVARVVG